MEVIIGDIKDVQVQVRKFVVVETKLKVCDLVRIKNRTDIPDVEIEMMKPYVDKIAKITAIEDVDINDGYVISINIDGNRFLWHKDDFILLNRTEKLNRILNA